MKFLLDANMPRSTASLLRGLGHEVEDVRELLPNGADDATVHPLVKPSVVSISLCFDLKEARFANWNFISRFEIRIRLKLRLHLIARRRFHQVDRALISRTA